MVKIGAMRFKFPKYTDTKVMMIVKKVPALGIFSAPKSFSKKESGRGRTLSTAKACKTLGAPNKLPTALDKEAPQTPG